jgi:hypothetical protein
MSEATTQRRSTRLAAQPKSAEAAPKPTAAKKTTNKRPAAEGGTEAEGAEKPAAKKVRWFPCGIGLSNRNRFTVVDWGGILNTAARGSTSEADNSAIFLE